MPETDTESGSSQSASQAIERANQSTKNFSDGIAQIRQRADYAAKGLAGIGTAAITAIGYTKLADVFPDGGPSWAPWLLGVGVLLMIIAVAFLVRRFHGASESVITKSDVDKTVALNDLSDEERKTIEETYGDMAELNGLDTLRAYEARGQRLERIADRVPDSEAKRLHEQAQLIFAEIKATQARASAFVLRERSTRALFSPLTYVLVGLFVVGWYSVALSADAMESKRTDEIAVAKSCVEAHEKKELIDDEIFPDICGTVKTGEKKEPTPAETSGQAVESSAKSWVACKQAARKAGAGAEDCVPLEKALLAAIGR
jgi:hypothetical protein